MRGSRFASSRHGGIAIAFGTCFQTEWMQRTTRRFRNEAALNPQMQVKAQSLPMCQRLIPELLLTTKSQPKPRARNKREQSIKPEPELISRQSTNGSLHAHSTRQDYGDDDSAYRTPVTRRSQRLAANGISKRQVKSEPWVDEEEDEELENRSEEEEHVDVAAVDAAIDWTSDKSKLKGVFWPGMSLFDSATEEQKRKRNQRKDAAVLRNMEQVAAGVEPTECVWTEDIDLQRTRDIYATPSVFGSPVCLPSLTGHLVLSLLMLTGWLSGARS